MDRQISFQQYRNIDLGILMLVLALVQWLISLAVGQWFPEQLYVVSPVAALTVLVMMRWGSWAAIHAVAGGVLFSILSGGTWQHHVIYGAGNSLALLGLIFFRLFGKERVRESAFLSLTFGLCVQLLMWLGRALLAAMMGHSLGACLGFITTDILSGLFTMVTIWIVRRIDGLFEDQKHYLLRIQSENQVEGREQF